MKYTARHVQRFMDQGKIDPELWIEHFPNVLATRVPGCNDCEDFKNKVCEGGKDPVDCFLLIQSEAEKTSDTQTDDEHRKKKVKPNKWTRKETERNMPPGTDMGFDQSRI